MIDVPRLLETVPVRPDEPGAIARARAIIRLAAADAGRILDQPVRVHTAAATLENYARRQRHG